MIVLALNAPYPLSPIPYPLSLKTTVTNPAAPIEHPCRQIVKKHGALKNCEIGELKKKLFKKFSQRTEFEKIELFTKIFTFSHPPTTATTILLSNIVIF